MASFVAMTPPGNAPNGEERAVLVRDGFAWLGFVFPVFWLLWHRLWIEAAAVFAATLALGTLGEVWEAPTAALLLTLLVQLLVGLEGQNWRLARLRRGGWTEAQAIESPSLEEAETRFFADRGTDAPATEPSPPPRPLGRPAPAVADAPLGLLGYR